jgi:hypothetical protein
MVNGIVLHRKAKLDKQIVNPYSRTLTVVDYKTTAYPVSSFASPDGAYYRYKLGRQLVSYADAFFSNNLSFNSGEWKTELFNIVVGTIDPYPVMVYKTNLYNYKDELIKLEERAAYHIKNNQWKITMEEAQIKDSEYISI